MRVFVCVSVFKCVFARAYLSVHTYVGICVSLCVRVRAGVYPFVCE